MILGIGVDLCPVDRVERIVGRHGDLFIDRVFTPAERAYAGEGTVRAERLAARFAAKEAIIKAMGGAPPGLRWQDIEVVHQESGAPAAVLRGSAEARTRAMGVESVWLSITHAGGSAVAMVVFEGGNRVG